MNGLLQDFRYALRQVRRNPGFTAFAVITLALGIGANSAIFSVVDAAVLHPLPFHEANGIMTLWTTDTRPGGYSGLGAVSDPDSVEWRQRSSAFEQTAFYRWHTFNFTGVGDPVRLVGAEVSASVFPLLQVKPALGRAFLPEEESAAMNRVVLLSHKLWQDRFAAAPGTLGRSIRLDAQFYTVVGVMPPGFGFPNEAQFWIPLTVTSDASNASLQLLARLKRGVSLERARAEVTVIANQLEEQANRRRDAHVTTTLSPLAEAVGSESRVSMFILLGAVGLLLLIGCANVANLLLARAAGRAQEIAIRNALGATRGRIMRQMITESLMLAGLGGIFGLVLAYAGRPLLASAAAALPRSIASPGAAARIAASSIDPSVLLFTFVISLLTGILFGLAPVMHASGPQPNTALKEGSRFSIGSPGRAPLREVLVITEISLAFVMLTSAGLLVRSFIKMLEVNPGFAPQNVVTMNVELPESRYQTLAQMVAFEEQALERLHAVPGVTSAGSVFGLPLGDILVRGDFVVENQPAPPPEVTPAKIVIGADYFAAIGIPVLAGRPFNQHDSEASPHVVVISQSVSRRFWPNQDPIGRRLKPGFSHDSWCTVVGVVGDVKQSDLREESAFALYFPYAQAPNPFLMQSLTLVIRSSSGDPSAIVAGARQAVAQVDPDLQLFDVASTEQLVYRSLAEPRFNTFLLGLFAALALLLAALGTYGVMSCVVTARTSEIGVRIALGANQGDVLRQILGRVMWLVAVGLMAGLAGAALASRLLGKLLYDVRPTDITTYAAVSILMILSALLAGYVPARRAARVDPMVALRYE